MRRGFFECSNLPRHLGKDGIEILKTPGQIINKPEQPIRKYDAKMCLICGDEVYRFHVGTWNCKQKCNILVHEDCVKVMCAVANCELIDRAEYDCSAIMYQFKPEEIRKCLTDPLEDSVSCFSVTELAKLRKIARSRGKVSSMGYFNKVRRFVNDYLKCDFCGIWYGTSETDHLAKYCEALLGDPIVPENVMYPRAKIARYCADYLVP
jgi:hypothetical protein